MKPNEREWSNEDLWKLFTAMREHLHDIALKRKTNWNKVAFPPFSPEECDLKWKQISQEEENKSQSETNDVEGLPTKPPRCCYNLFCKELVDSNPFKRNCVNLWAKRWQALPESQREKYQTRCTEMKKEYMVKLDKYLQKLTAEQEKIIKSSNSEVLQAFNNINSAADRPNPDRTSDSEDDNIEFSTSSSEEGEDYVRFNEDETEEEEDEDEVVMFQMY
ncbi:upstream-binding factor 1-like protein 1 [Cynoglossus semilaevis]|uniref:upstream-binding factor 1-like protein 1 n=1 Tax=Cynoglossus semilaevis TaxID=244447 RepID=UPI000495403D|nr:upstream-binding factor 1-like protein 1 [Cynoglossus semilaevis]XP_008312252.1 upstream-binding factor 1-like protein 1 [Cynoglossus semilaevis]XP_016889590.1 upstream-binding factor 1-like protein 1 [Cynoglossus semilaevis]